MKGKKIACLQSQLVSKQKRRKPLSDNDCLACQKGLEPPTPALGGRCSVQLSYWRICNFYSFLWPRRLRTRQMLGGWRSIQLSYWDSFQTYSIFPKLLASTDLKSVQLGNNFSVQWNFKNSGFSPVMRFPQSFLCLGSTLPTLCSYCAICVLANCIIIADFYKKSK